MWAFCLSRSVCLCLCFCLSVCFSVSVYLCLSPSLCLCLPLSLSVCPCLSVCVSVFLWPSLSLPLSVSQCLCLPLSQCLPPPPCHKSTYSHTLTQFTQPSQAGNISQPTHVTRTRSKNMFCQASNRPKGRAEGQSTSRRLTSLDLLEYTR